MKKYGDAFLVIIGLLIIVGTVIWAEIWERHSCREQLSATH